MGKLQRVENPRHIALGELLGADSGKHVQLLPHPLLRTFPRAVSLRNDGVRNKDAKEKRLHQNGAHHELAEKSPGNDPQHLDIR